MHTVHHNTCLLARCMLLNAPIRCIKWVEVDNLWLKEKEEQKQQQTTTLTLEGFRSWLKSTHADDAVHGDLTLRIIDNLCEDETQVSLKHVLQNGSCMCSMELFGIYIKFPRGGNGNLSTFWLSYMDMIEILLAIIRASR